MITPWEMALFIVLVGVVVVAVWIVTNKEVK